MSAVAVLRDPGWWAIALAGFLVRGGVVVALAPILVLPTVAGVADAVGPALIGFAFAGPSLAFVGLVAAVAVAALAWLVAATAAGAWLDLGLARETVEAVGIPGARVRDVPLGRAVAVRLLAHVPTAIVLGWAAVTIGNATYQELIAPGSPALPVPIRVILRVPDAVAILTLAWLAGEAVGGLALRAVAVGEGIGRALLSGVTGLIRPSGLATFLVTGLAVDVALVPLVVVPALAFDRVRLFLAAGFVGVDLLVALVALVTAWLAGLVVVSVALAFRQVAWTLHVARPHALDGPDRALAGGPSGHGPG